MGLFRSYKKTETVEKERNALLNDYKVYTATEGSEKLKTFLSLKDKVDSASFKKNRSDIENICYKGSGEQRLEKDFSRLSRNIKIKIYLEVLESENLKRLVEIEKSGLDKEYEALCQYIKSGEYKRAYKAFKKNGQGRWEESEAYQKNKRYQEIEHRPDFQLYSSFKKSKRYKIYKEIDCSAILFQYEKLKEEINSSSFKERKAYLLDTKRYEKTSDFADFKQYEQLKSDLDIQLYFKYKDTDAFKFYRKWGKSFEEIFDSNTVDPNRWTFLSPIESKGPGKSITSEGYYHYNNGAKNIDVKGNVMTINVLKENIKGLCWDKRFGFLEKTFDISTSIIHSFGAFKQQYGYFDIKLKASRGKGIVSTVALVDENEDNAILLFSSDGRKAYGGVVVSNKDKKDSELVNLKYDFNGYIIVSVKWTPDKVTWRVNGKPMGSVVRNLPHSKLGLRIGCEAISLSTKLPYRLDIDFIRCYTRN